MDSGGGLILFNDENTFVTFLDLEQHLEILADHGKLVQCSKPSEFDSIGMSVFLRNICISVIKPEDAFLELINKSSEHLQALLFNMHHEGISKVG